MAYLVDMPATCKARSTNPEYPVHLLESISGEFDKGLNGGIFDASYVLSKLETITRHVKWLEEMAVEERRAEYEPELPLFNGIGG
jgi:hypothetical protein